MRGIPWLAVKTGQLLKKDSAPWSKEYIYIYRERERERGMGI
jgi:hypothetical protein